MNRRKFISTSSSGLLALSLFPFNMRAQEIVLNFEELIGKGSPDLVGNGYKLRPEVNNALLSMASKAKKSGIRISCVSGYRSFERQKQIWERKYKKFTKNGLSPEEAIQKIIEYSTIPGTSRHHWGTEMDIVDGNYIDTPNLLSASNFEPGKPFHKLKVWLEEHAAEFGFYRVYTDVPGRKGFKYEPWHYSFKPLSVDYLKSYKELDILTILKDEKINGSEYFTPEFIDDYRSEHILDINPELLPS